MSLVGIRTFLGALFLLFFVLRNRKLTKELLFSGIFLGPLLAIHWSTMFKSIELNTVAVGIGLVFSYPIFILIIELFRGKTITFFQIVIILIGFFGLYLLLDFTTISSVAGVVYLWQF
jgi:drug/metabolite transporter (DMT)-like permease